MVRAKVLEPQHLSILVPKTSASTNSATPAGVFGRVHEIARCRARPCGPRGAIADAWPRARAQSPPVPRAEHAQLPRAEHASRPFVDQSKEKDHGQQPRPASQAHARHDRTEIAARADRKSVV